MGNCCIENKANARPFEYPEELTIYIKEKDAFNKLIKKDIITFNVTSPSYQFNDKFKIKSLSFDVSACVIPGLDPRQLVNKECQDSLICVENQSTILLALFDGHGKEGQRVVNFCCSFMKNYFIENYQSFVSSPKEAVENIIVNCDMALRSSSSKVEAKLSGTTGVVVYIDSQGFHAASVGDSRAILATVPNNNIMLENNEISRGPYVRKINVQRILKPVSLTVDQKPNHENELKRIEACGGKVQQLTDDFGNRIGPFRVWQSNGILPGLAMSRSIGDGLGKEIGVIADPIYHFFQFSEFRDQFIVMASDGVWDVMENIEAVNFVEFFRKSCLKKHGPKAYPHRVSFI